MHVSQSPPEFRCFSFRRLKQHWRLSVAEACYDGTGAAHIKGNILTPNCHTRQNQTQHTWWPKKFATIEIWYVSFKKLRPY